MSREQAYDAALWWARQWRGFVDDSGERISVRRVGSDIELAAWVRGNDGEWAKLGALNDAP